MTCRAAINRAMPHALADVQHTEPVGAPTAEGGEHDMTTLKTLRLSELIVTRARRALAKADAKRADALARLEAEQARHAGLVEDYLHGGRTPTPVDS